MSIAYNMLLSAAKSAVLLSASLAPDGSSAKFVRFSRGQKTVMDEVESLGKKIDRSRPVIWIHAASLGEFSIARPIIRALKDRIDCSIVVTFFSPTGYEALRRKPMEETEGAVYLPLDTEANAARFLDIVKPDCALFMVSEFWHNYLAELARRKIPTFLVSALIRDDGPFFKWYGGIYRKSLHTFRHIFTLDSHSIDNLRRIGVEEADSSLNGDPLFDNAALVAGTDWSDELIEKFKAGQPAFIAGSIHDDEDLEMVTEVANRHPETKFIIVPHEIKRETLDKLKKLLKGKTYLYSEAADADIEKAQTLIIDHIGALAYIYRYADWAYVGGGFTPLLHSVIEPVVYGLPVAFGPSIHRKVTPRQLIDEGIGRMVTDADELDSWFCELRSSRSSLDYIRKKARNYIRRNLGATPRVAEAVIRSLPHER